ncbi:MAG: flippase-like domain-containing protein, partial [Chloroflexi bacterium]|nr:flippase-like domain-containing protein [Chloroflexota bacterium]
MENLPSEPIQKKRRIGWGQIIGLVVSAVFLVISIRNLHPGDVWEALRQAQYVWIVPGVILYLLALGARTARWRQLLLADRRIRWRDLLPTMAMGRGANNIYPFRTGEIVRILILRQRNGVPVSAGLASILVERIFDGLTMILFLILAALIGGIPSYLRYVVWMAVGVFGAALAAVYAVVLWPEPIRRVADAVIDRLTPRRFHDRLRGIVDSFIHGLASVKSARTLTLVLFFSICVWTAETISYRLLMNAFGFTVTLHELLLMSGAANLGTALPSGPGNVGTFDAPAIEVLSRIGVPRNVAFSYQMVLHAVL